MPRQLNTKSRADSFLKRIRGASFEAEYWDGERICYGIEKPKFTIRMKDPSIVQTVLANPIIALPEVYIAGSIDIDGDLQEVIRLCYDIDFSQLRLSVVQRLVLVFRAMGERNSLSGAKRNVSHHYDLGNEFFRIWLDKLMVYSCAYFENLHDDLDTAQRQKLHYILSKLQLEPGQQLLDIGCGWGALTRYAASSRGVNVLGITLSDEQRALCETCLKEAGLQDRVEIRLQDYRQLGGRIFDRVVSVGMMEHVGQSYISEYMETVAKSLRPGGRGVFQWISKNKPGEVTPWIRKRIFPGMYLPTLAEISSAMAAAGLHIVDVENLRTHYAMTLDAWSDRFERSTDAVRRMYDERFVRMWRMYLNVSSVAFKLGELDLWQVTFTKGVSNSTSLTRRYLYPKVYSPDDIGITS